jgi:hypothetical protein
MKTPPNVRRMVNIVAVNAPTRKIQGRLKDNTGIPIAVLEIPNLFVWPQVGENWMVERKAGTWYLLGRIDNPVDVYPVESIPLGDGRINANHVRLNTGNYMVESKVSLPLTITGSKASGAALESLLTQLVAAGIILDHTTT